mgnify:CR=1 FL=1
MKAIRLSKEEIEWILKVAQFCAMCTNNEEYIKLFNGVIRKMKLALKKDDEVEYLCE